ncbi:MAG TPA: hypothetical protein VNA44_07725 [Burkholderiaceae bacterium]|nr:hypothetical protein [Burkholderiaceae bacterium]
METNGRLDDWLAAARSDLAERTPDVLTEQQLLARVREVRALQSVAATRIEPRRERDAEPWRRVFDWRVAALAGAAMLAVALTVLILAPDSPARDATVRTPFLALVASEAIAAAPSAVIVSSQVAGATLSDYGLPVDPARIDQPVRAEFLLSPTGLVLAVRFAE